MKIYLLFEKYSDEEEMNYNYPQLIKAFVSEEKANQGKLRFDLIEQALRKKRDECILCPIHRLTKRKFKNPINKEAVISYCKRGNFTPNFQWNYVECITAFYHIDKEYYIDCLEVEDSLIPTGKPVGLRNNPK